ncbi:Suppression of tumorigenicity 5 protein [Nymphon striatum]|nr:Suppression of tumorigenicity 5 protein [Nymphon striatum]
MNKDDDRTNVKSSPRVLDILQKFESNVTSNNVPEASLSAADFKNANSKQSPVLQRHNISKNKGSCLPNRNTSNCNVNSNNESRKSSPPVHRKSNEERHPVSVSERTRIFQDLGNSFQNPPIALKPSVKRKTNTNNLTNSEDYDCEPLPTGPPPQKPPRTYMLSPEKQLAAEDSMNVNFDSEAYDMQQLGNRPIPATRKKRLNSEKKVTLVPETQEASTESRISVVDEVKIQHQSSSFLHGRFENLTLLSKETEISKIENRKTLQRKLSSPVNHPNKSNSGSVRRKDIQRPKNPPPKPPPPNFSGQDSVKKVKNESSMSDSTNINNTSQFYMDPQTKETEKMSSISHSPVKLSNLQKSHSDENLYAVPVTANKSCNQPIKVKSLPKNEYAAPYEILHLKRKEPEELHYMSSPVPGFEKKKLESTPRNQRKVKTAIKDIINQSFSALKKTFTTKSGLPEEGAEDSDDENDVSVEDVRERIIYVQSIKHKAGPTVFVTSQPRLFEYLLVIGLEWVDSASKNHPIVFAQFPEQIEFKQDKGLIAKFCYPDSDSWKPVSEYESETYSFVLTDDKGVQTFAYCKRTLPPSQDPCTPIVYCLVCTERDFHFYKKLLDEIENRLNQINAPSNSFLEELYDRNLPKPGEVFYCPESLKGDEEVSIQRSADAQTESVEFSHLLKALHVETLIKAFSVILMERRILFCANTLTVLTQCVQGLAALLYPFTWQHTLVPVIPETMLDLCSLPAPFVMGVLTNSIDKVKELPLEDVLIVDLDYSRIIQETVDINATIIPRKIRAALSTALTLANSMTDPTAMYLTTVMSETFVRMFVHLVGHYENHIIVNQDGDLHFERDSFCKAPYSRGIQMFLKWFCETQTFDVFINKRLNTTALHMKKRRDFDLFERRCEEHRLDMEQLSQTFKGNFREIGKKVKDFSEFVINCYQYLVLF